MEQRNRGIDLLRMTAMWMVVILHILNKGGVLAAAAPLSAGQGTARLLETAAYCAVNCYGLISGYVGVQRRFRYSGALALWLRVAFYTLVITAVFACLMPGSVNGDRVLRAFFPVLFRQYWYVTAYFGMCLFIPFFNLLLNRLSKGQLRLLALILHYEDLCRDAIAKNVALPALFAIPARERLGWAKYAAAEEYAANYQQVHDEMDSEIAALIEKAGEDA